MAEATNHRRKKAAKKMARWRRVRREAALRELCALGAEYVQERLHSPSYFEVLFPVGQGALTLVSPTGRNLAAAPELGASRGVYLPGKTSGVFTLQRVDYAELERRAVAAQGTSEGVEDET